MKSLYAREKRTKCGPDCMEVDLFPITAEERRCTRGKKCRESSESQKRRNERHAARHRRQVANASFSEAGFYVTMTYDDEYLPDSFESAKRDLSNYIRRVRSKAWRTLNILPASIRVMGIVAGPWQDGKLHNGKGSRCHSHILIEAVGTTKEKNIQFRELLEQEWAAGRGKDRESMGTVRTSRLNMRDRLSGLMEYLEHHKYRGEVYWYQAKNLVMPQEQRPNDTRWSIKRMIEACREHEKDAYWWECKYPGWRFVEVVLLENQKAEQTQEADSTPDRRHYDPCDLPRCYVVLARRPGYVKPKENWR